MLVRIADVGLKLHPDKTRIVYCKDSNRRGEQEHISFTFLGFAFRPREAIQPQERGAVHLFSPAISPEALKAKGDRLREMQIHRRIDLTLNDLAAWPNPIVAGLMHYYGRFYRSALDPLLRRVSFYLKRWAGKKYKRLASPQTVPTMVGSDSRIASPAYSPTRSGHARTRRLVRRAR